MNESKRRGRQPKADAASEVESPAQTLARRIWDGQSISLPTKERLARVERGLQAQGMSMEGVTLP